MRNILTKLRTALRPMTARERYLSTAVDLADLEFRMKNWDRMEVERSQQSQRFWL